MKTNEEIQREAQAMIVQGRAYRDEQRPLVGAQIVALPRVLVRLPVSELTSPHEAEIESESVHTHRFERHVEALLERDELLYRLIERETERTGSGRVVRESDPQVVMVSRSGFDLLHTGYEMVEEDRLSERLTPYAERCEERAQGNAADEQTVSEVEKILETSLLAHSDRLRAKAEIVEFLEGRLEASAFIAHAIDRQCARETPRETVSQRQEMKLTIDES